MADTPPGLPPLPPEVSSLGPARDVYPVSGVLQIICWVVGVLGVVVAAAIPVLLVVAPPKGDSSAMGVALAVSVVFLVCGVALIGWAVYSRGLCVIVFDDALVKLYRGRTDVYRWDDIKAVREVVHPVGNRYRITTNDGRHLRLNYQIKNINTLGEAIMARVMDRLQPRALRQLEQGGTVNFGPLGVSREGLTYKDRHLPWEDVDRVSVSASRRRGWCSSASSKKASCCRGAWSTWAPCPTTGCSPSWRAASARSRSRGSGVGYRRGH